MMCGRGGGGDIARMKENAPTERDSKVIRSFEGADWALHVSVNVVCAK